MLEGENYRCHFHIVRIIFTYEENIMGLSIENSESFTWCGYFIKQETNCELGRFQIQNW